jgi:hypothetical protein
MIHPPVGEIFKWGLVVFGCAVVVAIGSDLARRISAWFDDEL